MTIVSDENLTAIRSRYVFASQGLVIAIELDDPELIAPLRVLLPPGDFLAPLDAVMPDRTYRVEWRADRGGYWITGGEQNLGVTITPETAIQWLESDLQMYIAEFAATHLFLHAGVVRWLGMTIVMPGFTHAGKSTLTMALVNAGATYFSDEFALLDHDGRVQPYARNLYQREGPLGPSGLIDLEAHSPVEDELFVPPLIDIVALIRYEADAAWTATRLEGGAAVLATSEHMVAMRRRPKESMQVLAKIVEHAQVYRCTRPDIDSAVVWLRSLAEDRAS